MADIIAKIRTSSSRAAIVSPNFQLKPDVALVDLTDTAITAPENGQFIAYNSATNKFENKFVDVTSILITNITGGTF